MVVGKMVFSLAVLLIYSNILNTSILESQQEDIYKDDPILFNGPNSSR